MRAKEKPVLMAWFPRIFLRQPPTEEELMTLRARAN